MAIEIILQNVWNKLDYCLDMSCHPMGTHRTFVEGGEKIGLVYGYFDISIIFVSMGGSPGELSEELVM